MAQAIVDYVTLAPHQPACRLIVGAHDHWSCARPEHLGLILRVVLDCLETHLPPAHHTDHATAGAAAAGSLRRAGCPPLRGFHGEGGAARPDAECALPVQLCFLGSHRWVGYAAWPPPVTPATLYLAHSRQLTGEPPPPAAAATAPLRYSYVYHPAEPTPAAGGPSFNPLNSGAVDQRRIERRPHQHAGKYHPGGATTHCPWPPGADLGLTLQARGCAAHSGRAAEPPRTQWQAAARP